jgi:alpha-1,4-galacturonosyltransferase
LKGKSDIPETLEEFMTEMNEDQYDAKTFAIKLREMVTSILPLF